MNKIIDIWEKIESKEIADCKVFKVREDRSNNPETDQTAAFYVIENPDWVNIIALTRDDKAVLIEQYRHGTQEITLEIPGGMIDPGEEAGSCAKRELLEETGFSSTELVYLGKSRPNPAIQTNWIYHFLAKDCVKISNTSFDEHESIKTKLVDLATIDDLIESELITHSLVLAGFYRFEKYLKRESEKYIYES